MPSSLNSLEYSRGFTFHIDESPRYGNFQNLDYLPRVGRGARAGEHYVPYFTNQQIFKTVSAWVTSWQPWQQRVLLCGIADRLPVHQIDILATTLEPVCHRDYVTACRHQYPSTPFRTGPESGLGDNSDEEFSSKESTKSEETNLHDEIIPSPPGVSHNTSSPAQGGSQVFVSLSQPSAAEIAQEILNDVVQKVFNIKDLDESCQIPENTEKRLHTLGCHDGTNNAEVLTEVSKDVTDDVMNSINLATDNQDCGKAVNVCEECSLNDSGLILSRSESELSLPRQTPPENIRHSRQENRLVTNLAGNLKQHTYKRLSRSVDHIAVLKKISPRSPFKHKSMYLPSPQLQTPDFFNRTRMSRLGPLQRSLDINNAKNGLIDAKIPLNLTYKNAKWWTEDPPNGRVYIPARKQELLSHYKEQLQQIWKWLELWSDFERVAFVKEVIKSSETDVITTFADYIHQRLRDARDINRLSDGLLLQVFSYLSPAEVCRAAQVCRRWRYVAATDSLWRNKCQQLVDSAGLGELNELVMRLGSGRQGVDWRKAHMELTALANHRSHRLHALAPIPLNTDPVESVEGMRVDDQSVDYTDQAHQGQLYWKTKEKAEEIRVKLGTESQIIRYKQAEVLSDDDSDISEDLIPLMMDYNYFSTNALKEKKSWQSRRVGVRKYPVGRTRIDVADAQRMAEEKRTLEQVVKTSRERIKPEDLAYDIRPRLRQTKDLLGKTEARHRLQWGPVASKQTPPQSEAPVTGQVTAIRRVRKLQGHEGGVLCVHFDQRRLASGGWDRVIRLWDVRSGRSLRKFYGHRGGVHSLVFDNDIMVSGSWDMTIMVWCMKKFTHRQTIHDHRGCVSCLCLHPKYIISGSHDKTVRVYSRLTLLCLTVISDHKGAITCLNFDGTNVLSGSTDKTLRLTNIRSQETLMVFTGMQASVLSLQSQGRLLIGGDSMGRVYFWDQSTGESEAAIQAHDGPVNSLGFWSGRLLTASGDCTIKEWDINTMTAVRCLDGHKGPVNQMKISDKRIVSCSEDGNVRIWDTFISGDSQAKAQRRSVSRKPKTEKL